MSNEAIIRDLFTGNRDWTWIKLPQITGIIPWLIFLYEGLFVFENNNENKQNLEVYNYLIRYSRICFSKNSRVLVIYKAKE